MSNMIKIGGLWKAKDASSKTVLSGKIGELESNVVLKPGMKLLVFANTYKQQGDNKPDYQIYAAEAESAPQKVVPIQKDDDEYVPF